MSSQNPDTDRQAQLSETPAVDNDHDTDSTQSVDADSSGTQVGLTDVSYDGHVAPEPPEDRVTESLHYEEFFESGVGDVIWVDGTEYVIVDRPMRLIAPSPLLVVSEDGDQGELIAGELPDGSTDGVTWVSNVSDKESHEISRSDLICGYDRVYRLEESSWKHVHNWTPDTDERECPTCDDGRSGEPLRIEEQSSNVVEIRRCTDTDCKYVYRYVREFPTPEPATIVTHDYNEGSFEVDTVTGVFRAEDQDDFKFPVETHKGRDDGFWTASEIAEFVNPKMVGPEIASLLNSDEDVSPEVILDELEFTTTVSKISGDETRPVESLGELYELYVADRLIPVDDEFTELLDDASLLEFFRSMQFLRRVIPDKPDYPKNEPEDTGFDVEADTAVALAREAVRQGSISDDLTDKVDSDVSDNVIAELESVFTASLTAAEIISTRVFKELLEEHANKEPFGAVEISTNRSGELEVEWRDAPRYEKKMRQTYTRIEKNQTNQDMFRWYLDRHDLSTIAP